MGAEGGEFVDVVAEEVGGALDDGVVAEEAGSFVGRHVGRVDGLRLRLWGA